MHMQPPFAATSPSASFFSFIRAIPTSSKHAEQTRVHHAHVHENSPG